MEFLSLDDIECPSKNSIDMEKDTNSPVVSVIPITPMALVPPEEMEKKNNPLFSRRGEILGSRKDFRMNTCTPHATGAFILELNNASPMSYLNKQQQDNTEHNKNGLQDIAQDKVMDSHDCQAPVLALHFSDDVGHTGIDDGGDVDDVFLPQLPEEKMDQEHITKQKGVSEAPGYTLREKQMKIIDPADRKEVLDPWRSLDPFEATQDKPFKKGRYFIIPSCVNVTGTKRKRKSFGKVKDFGKWFSGTYYGGRSDTKNKKRGPMFADMEVLYWKHMKEKLGAQRKYQQRMIVLRGRVIEELETEAGNVEEELNKLQEQDEDHLDYDEVEDDYGIDLEHEVVGSQENHSPMNLDPLGEAGFVSYEELVRRNVELFIANSQQYVQETALSLRIKNWEEMIGPRLEKEEERAAFAIHDYADRIVDSFDYVKQRRSFVNIVSGKESFEVCRYMLASLQLANDYTVEIWQKDGLYESVDTMELTLLSKVRAHDRFRTYMAPSLSNK